MPTPAERKALVFLTGLVVLGTGARLQQATAHASVPSAASRAALRRQVAAVDSVRKQGAKKKRRGARHAVVRASHGATARPAPKQGTGLRDAIVMERVPVVGVPTRVSVRDAAPAPSTGVVDLDVAPEAEIEKLPRIGPVLARRIVADRDSLGPFGSLEELQRVKGIGKTLAKRLAPYVTFSLQPRPSRVLDRARGAKAGRRRRPPGSG